MAPPHQSMEWIVSSQKGGYSSCPPRVFLLHRCGSSRNYRVATWKSRSILSSSNAHVLVDCIGGGRTGSIQWFKLNPIRRQPQESGMPCSHDLECGLNNRQR